MKTQLLEAVKTQLSCDTEQELKETCTDIANYGIDGGFSGFIYYSDTVAFFDANKDEIIEHAKEQASDFGVGVFEMISGFNCLNDVSQDEVAEAIYSDTDDSTYVRNALAWYAAEEAARIIAED